MKITFYGACREVTGSNFLIESNGKKILLECGIFQGFRLAEERNYNPFAYNPAHVDMVIIGHAHLDHTGRLPKLIRDGFAGRIYATAPTKELTSLVLEDNLKLMREEARRDKHPTLYDENDIKKTLELFETISYSQTVEISPSIRLTFKNAGHILGSAITTIEAEGKKIAYTSDIGSGNLQLMEAPEVIDQADYVVSESTYGGRTHEDINRRSEKLANIINRTIAQNGILLIPTFAIERTQELLHDIEHFCTLGNCQKPTFFLDSPLAAKVTRVFGKYPEFLAKKILKAHRGNDYLGLEKVHFTTTVSESQAIANWPNPKVIIAGSGMMNGGRILFHAQKYLADSKNTLLLVSYQPRGSLGRRLIEGERNVRIMGKAINVQADIESIRSYSAHADMPHLVDWLSKVKTCRKIFIVHGESDQALNLKKTIDEKLKIETIIPQQGEGYEL